jgi:hypothetical protein
MTFEISEKLETVGDQVNKLELSEEIGGLGPPDLDRDP